MSKFIALSVPPAFCLSIFSLFACMGYAFRHTPHETAAWVCFWTSCVAFSYGCVAYMLTELGYDD